MPDVCTENQQVNCVVIASSSGVGKAPAAINFQVNSQRIYGERVCAKNQLCLETTSADFLALVHGTRERPKNAPYFCIREILCVICARTQNLYFSPSFDADREHNARKFV